MDGLCAISAPIFDCDEKVRYCLTITLTPFRLQKHKLRAGGIEKIEVGVNEGVLLHGGTIYEPKEVIEAQFSLRFSLALRLLKRRNDLECYLDPKIWREPEILEMGKKIVLYADPTATGERRFACTMKITLSGGNIIEGNISSPKGASRNPLSTQEIRNKFFRLGTKILPDSKSNAIIDKMERLETEKNIAAIMPLMTVKAGV